MTMGRPLLAMLLAAVLVGCGGPESGTAAVDGPSVDAAAVPAAEPTAVQAVESPALVAAARSQVGRTTSYDGAYVSLAYPGGDVPIATGVCTDVVIRALRDGYGMDLQRLVHEDMKASFARYPTIWGLSKPDRNIDHRRVPNLRTYFDRHGYTLPVTQAPADYLPGDLVTCKVGSRNLDHIMIVSDRTTADGVPLVIHNIGSGAQEEPRLFAFTLTGHYRIPPPEPAPTR